jgi:hypothetical protein
MAKERRTAELEALIFTVRGIADPGIGLFSSSAT